MAKKVDLKEIALTKDEDDRMQILLRCINAAKEATFKGQLDEEAFRALATQTIIQIAVSRNCTGTYTYKVGKLIKEEPSKEPDKAK